MKKKIIPFLFSLCLLAGCGDKQEEQVQEEHVHSYGDWSITKEATCKEAGLKERKCSCGDTQTEEIAKLTTHTFGEWVETAATCKADGKKERVCSVCGEKETEVLPKLTTHNYVDAADQTGAVAPTCKDTGTVITECTVCGAKSTRVVEKTEEHVWGDWNETTPATHTAVGKKTRTCSVCNKVETEDIEKTPDHSFGETPVGTFEADHDLSGYKVYNCEAENAKKIVWNANDVNPNTKNVKYNDEANYVVDGEGVKFGGRPIGNAMALPANFMNHTAVYDANVPGAFLEYNINVKKAVENVQLVANMKPASGLHAEAGLFLSAPEGSDWTPGLVAADNEAGYKIADFRYVVKVNGNEVALDPSKNVAASDASQTGWYNFPCTFRLKAGVNTIRLVQAGGWEATFYEFALISAEGVDDIIPAVSEGYEVAVTGDSHVTGVTFFEDKACTVEDTAEKHYSRNDAGRKLNDGEGQVSFAVAVEEGYEVKEIKQVSPEASKVYKNIKNPLDTSADNGRNDVYRITKIEDNCAFEIVTQAKGSATYEGFEFTFVLGEHITKIEIYNSKVCNPDTLVEGLVATSLDKSTLKPTKTDGQIYLKIFCDSGYEVDTANVTWSTEEKPFNKFEAETDGGENAYKFTKVTASATITLVAKAVVA